METHSAVLLQTLVTDSVSPLGPNARPCLLSERKSKALGEAKVAQHTRSTHQPGCKSQAELHFGPLCLE